MERLSLLFPRPFRECNSVLCFGPRIIPIWRYRDRKWKKSFHKPKKKKKKIILFDTSLLIFNFLPNLTDLWQKSANMSRKIGKRMTSLNQTPTLYKFGNVYIEKEPVFITNTYIMSGCQTQDAQISLCDGSLWVPAGKLFCGQSGQDLSGVGPRDHSRSHAITGTVGHHITTTVLHEIMTSLKDPLTVKKTGEKAL